MEQLEDSSPVMENCNETEPPQEAAPESMTENTSISETQVPKNTILEIISGNVEAIRGMVSILSTKPW